MNEKFDKELWKKCCDDEFVKFVTKKSIEYPFVLQRYHEQLELRKTPEYIEHVHNQKEQEKRRQEKREQNKELEKQRRESQRQNKEEIKKGQKIAADRSMSWGT